MRTKKQIIESYKKFLISKGFDCKGFSDEILLEMLMTALYETEVYQGQKISTTKAFWHFCKFVIYIDPASQRSIWNPFIKEMFEMIERNRLTALMAPRSSGKSYLIFILYPLFKSFLWEYFEAILCSNIPRMAKRNFRILIHMIEQNELLLDKKEKVKEISWSKNEIEYNKGLMEAISMGTTPRSAHVNYVVGDDPLRDDNKYTDDYNLNFFLGQILPCIRRRRGRMVICGTPQHEEDLFHTLMKDKDGDLIKDGGMSAKRFFSKVYDAIIDEEKHIVLDNDSFTWDSLQQEREIQGDLFFMREYRCVCFSRKQAIFPDEIIQNAVDNTLTIELVGEVNANYLIGVDVATSGSASADYSAFTILKLLKEDKKEKIAEGTKLIVKVVHPDKGMPIDKQIEKIEELANDFNHAAVIVEENNVGVSLIQELQKKGVNVTSFRTDRIKKTDGIRFLHNELKHRRLRFPKETSEIKTLKNELRSFGVKKKRGIEVMEALTGHDDLVDSLWIVNKFAQTLVGRPTVAILQD